MRVITYGTFDLFHLGHLRLLERARALGSELVVGVSTDDFNKVKGKHSHQTFIQRRDNVLHSGLVSEVIPEENWEQKPGDLLRLGIGVFCMGSDWAGMFDDLRQYCEVIYFPRTDGIDSTAIRRIIALRDQMGIDELVREGVLLASPEQVQIR